MCSIRVPGFLSLLGGILEYGNLNVGAVQANDVLFVEEKDAEPMTFREVFLRSSALQNIVAGEALIHTLYV